MGAGRQPVRLLRATMGTFSRLLQPAYNGQGVRRARHPRECGVARFHPRRAGGGLTALEALPASQTALGRVSEPDEVARVIAMLLSDDAAWIDGQSIEVAGGCVA